jgi:hypothetical protein
MSGNAFKDMKIKRINYNTYLNLMSELNKLFLNVKAIGSSQRFEGGYLWQTDGDIGDLDLAVGMSKQRIISIVESNTLFKAKKVFGNTVSTVIEIKGSNFHVDLMTSKNTDDESWIMTGGTPKIKGVMRNVLICFIARLKSEKDSLALKRKVKWTVAFPGGIGLKEGTSKLITGERVTSPAHIMSSLGMPNKSVDIEKARTFEGLIEYVSWNQALVDEFVEYARGQWIFKKDPDVINDALEYLSLTFNKAQVCN